MKWTKDNWILWIGTKIKQYKTTTQTESMTDRGRLVKERYFLRCSMGESQREGFTLKNSLSKCQLEVATLQNSLNQCQREVTTLENSLNQCQRDVVALKPSAEILVITNNLSDVLLWDRTHNNGFISKRFDRLVQSNTLSKIAYIRRNILSWRLECYVNAKLQSRQGHEVARLVISFLIWKYVFMYE